MVKRALQKITSVVFSVLKPLTRSLVYGGVFLLTPSLHAQTTPLDAWITPAQWDALFPRRAGTYGAHPQGYTGDFYSFAHLKQASAANNLMREQRLDPCMSECFGWAAIPEAHTKMRRNEHKPGNMAVLVQAPVMGLRTFEDTLEAAQNR